MAQQNNLIDLFGNSTKSPREIIQEQINKSFENTEALYKDAAPVNRAAAIWGSGLGTLFTQVLQEKGIIEKPVEVKRAEEAQNFRGEVNRRVQEAGIDVTKNPEAMGDFAVKVLTERNEDGTPKYKYLEDMLPKALQYSMTMQAAKRAAELEGEKLKTEKTKQAKDMSGAERDIAEAEKARSDVGKKKFEFVPQFDGEKWQDMKVGPKGELEPWGKPYTMDQKSKSKGESQSPTWNTGLRALNNAFNYSDTYGLKDPQQLPAYNRGLKLLSQNIAGGIDPLEAASKAAADSQSQHKDIMAKIKALRAQKTSREQIEKWLKEAGLDPKLYLK